MQATRNRIYTRIALADRLFDKLAQRDSGCIEFVGAQAGRGYGVINEGGDRGRCLLAHRVAWELANGPIPPGLDICHTCDNPPCCNPDHLFLGTRRDNMQDAKAKGRAVAPPVQSGETHNKAWVTDAVVRECREQHANGEAVRDIAASRGFRYEMVWTWITGRHRVSAGGPILHNPRALR